MSAVTSTVTAAARPEQITIHIAGENSLILYFGQSANVKTLAKVQHAAQLIRYHMASSIIDIVPSYASIMVMFNLLTHDHQQISNELMALCAGLDEPSQATLATQTANTDNAKVVELPVYYGLDLGLDLAIIAKQAKLSVAQVIDIHQAQEYHVYAIGFAPGFAYLGEVDERIAIPRLTSPRVKVPKGAVAIADKQTAVYPNDSPGGWHILGLCPVPMFDAQARPSMPVQVGDKVKFKAIDKAEFIRLGGIVATAIEASQ